MDALITRAQPAVLAYTRDPDYRQAAFDLAGWALEHVPKLVAALKAKDDELKAAER